MKRIKQALWNLSRIRKKNILYCINTDVDRLKEFIQAVGTRPDNKLATFLNSPSLTIVNQNIVHANKRRQQAINRQRAKVKKKVKADIALWKDGKLNKLTMIRDFIGNSAYLRNNSLTGRIETSKNVEMPIEAAEKFWHFIKKCLSVGCSNNNYKIAAYQVDVIDRKLIKVGCHSITMSEVQRIVELLNWN